MEKYYEKIMTYLNNSFASFPQNDATMRMKNDMYCSMLDKFNGLVQGGVSEDEAFGKVVGEFGSLDEIRAAMCIEEKSPADTVMLIDPERKKAYDRFKIKQGIMVAVGVVLCIIAVFTHDVYDTFLVEELTDALFGFLVATGVFLFIFAGTIEAKYFDVTDPVKYVIPPTAERMAAYQNFLTVRALVISSAVFLFITSVFVMPLFEGSFMELVLPAVMVAFGVAMLIIVGTVHGTYNDVSGRK